MERFSSGAGLFASPSYSQSLRFNQAKNLNPLNNQTNQLHNTPALENLPLPPRKLNPQEREALQFSAQLLDQVFQRPNLLINKLKTVATKFAGLAGLMGHKHLTTTPSYQPSIKQQFQQWQQLNKKYAQLSPQFSEQFNQKLADLLDCDPNYATKVVSELRGDPN